MSARECRKLNMRHSSVTFFDNGLYIKAYIAVQRYVSSAGEG
jgi:hypothetical protein